MQPAGEADMRSLAVMLQYGACVVSNAGTILLDSLVNDRPAVCVLYDEGAPLGETWAAKNVLGVHYRELMSSTAFYRAKSFDEVAAAIERASMSPASSRRSGGVWRARLSGNWTAVPVSAWSTRSCAPSTGGLVALQISVIGSGQEHEARAAEVGRLLAERGATLVCGALDEVMAGRGARRQGGGRHHDRHRAGESRADANPWIDHVVVTGIGHAATSPLPRRVMP